MTTLRAHDPASSALIATLMSPIEGGVPVDTHYNLLLRRTMRDAFWRAYAEAGIRRAQLEVVHWQDSLALRDGKPRPEIEGAIKALRQAVVSAILTPCVSRADIEWKKRVAKDRYLPVPLDRLEAAIAADEAFLAAHPTVVRRTRK